MRSDLNYYLASTLQQELSWDQGVDKLDEMMQFVADNYDESKELEENIVNLIDLHQKKYRSELNKARFKQL